MSIIVPKYVHQVCLYLNEHGFQAYLVGGAIRDSLLGLTPLDWDVATDALPEQIEGIFARTLPTGRRFGTVTVFVDDHSLEVTTLRQDGTYTDGRHPDQVFFTNNLEADLSRRDFTINAMAYDPLVKQLIDPFRGAKHLKRGILTTVGNPTERFQEDPLRMLRLLRFQATLGFRVEKKTGLALEARWINRVSAERISAELNKMLLGKELYPALKLFYQSALMREIIPELAAGAGISPGDSHPYDLLGHSITSAHFVYPSLPLRWAALLHDLGKLHSSLRDHAQLGAKIARSILLRLCCSNKLIHEVETLVGNHMFEIHPHSSNRAIRRFLARVGTDTAFQLVKLRQGDLAGMDKDPRLIIDYGQAMEARFREVLAQSSALTIKALSINGQELMNNLGLEPGPLVGELLQYLLEQVLLDPKLNHKTLLLNLAQNYLESKPENARSGLDSR